MSSAGRVLAVPHLDHDRYPGHSHEGKVCGHEVEHLAHGGDLHDAVVWLVPAEIIRLPCSSATAGVRLSTYPAAYSACLLAGHVHSQCQVQPPVSRTAILGRYASSMPEQGVTARSCIRHESGSEASVNTNSSEAMLEGLTRMCMLRPKSEPSSNCDAKTSSGGTTDKLERPNLPAEQRGSCECASG